MSTDIKIKLIADNHAKKTTQYRAEAKELRALGSVDDIQSVSDRIVRSIRVAADTPKLIIKNDEKKHTDTWVGIKSVDDLPSVADIHQKCWTDEYTHRLWMCLLVLVLIGIVAWYIVYKALYPDRSHSVCNTCLSLSQINQE